MKAVVKHLLLSTFAIIPTIIFLQTAEARDAEQIVDDAGFWFQAVGEGSLKVIDPSLEKARVWLEGQSRFDQGMDHWYQGMIRAAVGYSLSDRATIWAGYTYLPTQNVRYGTRVNGADLSEQDIWPAFRYILPTDFGTFTFRTMWESNFVQGSQIRERPRQLIKFMHPLDSEPRLCLIAWDEAFYRVNSTDWGGKSGFD